MLVPFYQNYEVLFDFQKEKDQPFFDSIRLTKLYNTYRPVLDIEQIPLLEEYLSQLDHLSYEALVKSSMEEMVVLTRYAIYYTIPSPYHLKSIKLFVENLMGNFKGTEFKKTDDKYQNLVQLCLFYAYSSFPNCEKSVIDKIVQTLFNQAK